MRILQINSDYNEGSTGRVVGNVGIVLLDARRDIFTGYGIGESYNDDFASKVSSNAEHKVNALLARIDGTPWGGTDSIILPIMHRLLNTEICKLCPKY